MILEDAITRRSFVKTVAGGLAATALPLRAAAKLNVGIGTYSYHNLSMDEMIVRLNALRVREIEMSRAEFMLMNHFKRNCFVRLEPNFNQQEIHCPVLLHGDHGRRSDLENAVRFARLLGSSDVTGDATGGVLNRIDRRAQEQSTSRNPQSLLQGREVSLRESKGCAERSCRTLQNRRRNGRRWTFGILRSRSVNAVRQLAARLILVHLKDIQAVDGEVNVLLGTGISEIPAVMQELHRQNFAGLVAVEYEKEADVNEDMRQDMEFACRLA